MKSVLCLLKETIETIPSKDRVQIFGLFEDIVQRCLPLIDGIKKEKQAKEEPVKQQTNDIMEEPEQKRSPGVLIIFIPKFKLEEPVHPYTKNAIMEDL